MRYTNNMFIASVALLSTISSILLYASSNDVSEQYLAIVVPSYNNEKWCIKNIQSLLSQRYNNYHIFYYDDCSEDNTYQKVTAYISEQSAWDKVTVIHNEYRRGALANIYHAVHALPNDAIVLTVDGDDWLAHEHVFSTVNTIYHQTGAYVTYGQFQEWPRGSKGLCREIPAEIIQKNAYRSYSWVTSHLRTFRAGLFKQICLKDLMYQGKFLQVSWDCGFMLPLIELAGGKISCIEDIVYIYNEANPINDFRIRVHEQINVANVIRSWKPYEPLDIKQIEACCKPSIIKKNCAVIVLSNHPTVVAKTLASLQMISQSSSLFLLHDGQQKEYHGIKKQFPHVSCIAVDQNEWTGKIKETIQISDCNSCIILDERTIITSRIPLENCLYALHQTKASALHINFSYDVLKGYITEKEHLANNIYAWQKEYSSGHAAQSHQSGMAYRTEYLLTQLPEEPVVSLYQWWQFFLDKETLVREVLLGYSA